MRAGHKMPIIKLFHGTAQDFTAFDDRFTLRGADPNSGLGIHLTEHPSVAADYASLAMKDVGAKEPRVLVVEVDASRMALVSDVEEFLGYEPGFFDPDTNVSREDFVAARHTLQTEGFDGVTVDQCSMDDITGTWVFFDPSRLKIVGSMSLDVAYDADQSEYEGVIFETRTLFPDGTTHHFEP